MNDKWEVVTNYRDTGKAYIERTSRLKVPGGWLYRWERERYCEGEHYAVSMVFVPDAIADKANLRVLDESLSVATKE